MPLTTKEQIFGKKKEKPEVREVYVKPWEDSVFIRVMTGKQRDAFDIDVFGSDGDAVSAAKSLENWRAKLCSYCLCDAKGKRIFSTKDIQELGEQNGHALTIIVGVAKEINGITAQAQKDMVKNLEDILRSDSNTGSASRSVSSTPTT